MGHRRSRAVRFTMTLACCWFAAYPTDYLTEQRMHPPRSFKVQLPGVSGPSSGWMTSQPPGTLARYILIGPPCTSRFSKIKAIRVFHSASLLTSTTYQAPSHDSFSCRDLEPDRARGERLFASRHFFRLGTPPKSVPKPAVTGKTRRCDTASARPASPPTGGTEVSGLENGKTNFRTFASVGTIIGA